MKNLNNRQIIIIIALLYFLPISIGILGAYLDWSIATRLIRFGIYTQGIITISFVVFLVFRSFKKK